MMSNRAASEYRNTTTLEADTVVSASNVVLYLYFEAVVPSAPH